MPETSSPKDPSRQAAAIESPSVLVDLREIASAKTANGEQDSFELFARDFLRALGFVVVQGPGRGADRGRDLIVMERVHGLVSNEEKKWLVSVKHYAPSGKSVSDSDEMDPMGRVRKFGAHGFLAFYSTIPSSGLDDTLDKLSQEYEVCRFDSGRICMDLISKPSLTEVFRQYLPKSYDRWFLQGQRVVQVWGGEICPLTCSACGKNIILAENAIYVCVTNTNSTTPRNQIVDVYFSCKGSCDSRMQQATHKPGYITTWCDISDLRIPMNYLMTWCSFLSRIKKTPDCYSPKSFEKFREMMVIMGQVVCRETTSLQRARIGDLKMIPSELGGLG